MSRSARIALISLLVGLAGGVWIAEDAGLWQPVIAQNPVATQAPTIPAATATLPPPRDAAPVPSDLSPDEQRNIHVYDTANRSVVNIDTKMVAVDSFWMMQREAEGAGSGAVLDRQGHIITNYHVVDDAQKIEVTLSSNSTYPARF